MRVAIFFDGKNYYSGWQEQTGGQPIDFVKLTQWLTARVGGTYLWGAYYYTGVERDETGVGTRLDSFLDTLEQKPGFFVRRLPRRRRISRCLNCCADNTYTEEKQLDTTMVADMVRLAAVDAYDIMILLSGDSDYAPAVEAIRSLGKQAYVATWGRFGLSADLRRVAFDHIDLIEGIEEMTEASISESVIDEPAAMEIFLDEVRRAEEEFANGYVGVFYFLNKWRSDRLDSSPTVRQHLLNRLIEDGLIEIYDAADGGKAMRVVDKDAEQAIPAKAAAMKEAKVKKA